MNKKNNPIVKEKISFIEDNSHVLKKLLDNKMSTNKTVLETVTAIIVSDKKLDECDDIEELKIIIELNRGISSWRVNDESDPYTVIFSVAQYINFSVTDQDLNNRLRNRLRLYTNSFNKEGIFSTSYKKFIKAEEESVKQVLEKM